MTNDLTTTTTNKKAPRETKPKPKSVFLYVLLGTVFILMLIFITVLLTIPQVSSSIVPHAQQNQEGNVEYLIDTNPDASKNNPSSVIHTWLMVLIVGFAALQIFPVVVASRKVMKKRLTQKIKKEIVFLCDVPMYFGLLGSLLGVCITQFMTGSLSAPLAYITTITGILIHLFAKFTIIVPMPGKTNGTAIEEV